jgi:hypothetical protein
LLVEENYMALVTVALNVPTTPGGLGSSTNVSTMEMQKTVQCICGSFQVISLQISNDSGATWVDASTITGAGSIIVSYFAQLIRVRMINLDLTKTPVVNITANTNATPLLTSTITVPTTGTSSTVDVTNMSLLKTIYCVGSADELVDIQATHDNSAFGHILTLRAGEYQTISVHASKIEAIALKADYRGTATVAVASASQASTGVASSKPSAVAVGKGYFYYASDINKPLWSDGTSWRDASGNVVS